MRLTFPTMILAVICASLALSGCRYRHVDDGGYHVPPKVAQAGRAVLDNPGDVDAWVALGDAYRSTRRFDEAYKAYSEANKLSPGDKTVQSRLAALKTYRPLSELERRILTDPNDDEAWGDLGDEHMAAGRNEEAIECYRRAASIDPADGEWQNKLLESGLDIGEMLDTWLTNLPDDDERIGDIADALVEQGRIEEALQLYQRAHEIDPDDSEWTRKIAEHGGGIAGILGGVEGGVEGGVPGGIANILSACGGAAEGDDEAIGDLGDVYAGQGNRELALQHYRRALEIDPSDSEWQGKVALYAGTATLADILEGRLAADPRNDEIMGALAAAYAELGHSDKAREMFIEALTIDPADGQWQGKLALLGGLASTQELLEHKRETDPDNDEVVGRLGDMHAFLGDRDAAIEAYSAALRLDPGDEEWRSSIQQIAGTAAVLDIIDPLIDTIEDDEALGDLADLYATAGRTDRALEIYRRAASLDPEDQEWQGKIQAFGP